GATVAPDLSEIYNWGVSSMLIGATNVKGFFGFGTPDFSKPLAGQDGLYGLYFDNITLGMAIMNSTLPIKIPGLEEFISIKATADSAGFTFGNSNWMTVKATGIELDVNDNKEGLPAEQ